MSADKPIRLQVIKQPERIKHVFTVTSELPVSSFQHQLFEIFKVPINLQQLYSGFPPKLCTIEADSTLLSIGLKPGDTLELRSSTQSQSIPTMKKGTGKWEICPTVSKQGTFKRIQMPADNSCMFHAIAYVNYISHVNMKIFVILVFKYICYIDQD
jgi:hypothetical protein